MLRVGFGDSVFFFSPLSAHRRSVTMIPPPWFLNNRLPALLVYVGRESLFPCSCLASLGDCQYGAWKPVLRFFFCSSVCYAGSRIQTCVVRRKSPSAHFFRAFPSPLHRSLFWARQVLACFPFTCLFRMMDLMFRFIDCCTFSPFYLLILELCV